jgi:hypothetical protein
MTDEEKEVYLVLHGWRIEKWIFSGVPGKVYHRPRMKVGEFSQPFEKLSNAWKFETEGYWDDF